MLQSYEKEYISLGNLYNLFTVQPEKKTKETERFLSFLTDH